MYLYLYKHFFKYLNIHNNCHGQVFNLSRKKAGICMSKNLQMQANQNLICINSLKHYSPVLL